MARQPAPVPSPQAPPVPPVPPTREPELIVAARAGDTHNVARILDTGVSTELRDSSGSTALHWASFDGRVAVVRLLIDRGCDVNALNPTKNCALSFAVQRGEMQTVELLLCAGAEPDIENCDRLTPLTWAAWGGRVAIAQMLCAAGADIHTPRKDNQSALAIFQAKYPAAVEAIAGAASLASIFRSANLRASGAAHAAVANLSAKVERLAQQQQQGQGENEDERRVVMLEDTVQRLLAQLNGLQSEFETKIGLMQRQMSEMQQKMDEMQVHSSYDIHNMIDAHLSTVSSPAQSVETSLSVADAAAAALVETAKQAVNAVSHAAEAASLVVARPPRFGHSKVPVLPAKDAAFTADYFGLLLPALSAAQTAAQTEADGLRDIEVSLASTKAMCTDITDTQLPLLSNFAPSWQLLTSDLSAADETRLRIKHSVDKIQTDVDAALLNPVFDQFAGLCAGISLSRTRALGICAEAAAAKQLLEVIAEMHASLPVDSMRMLLHSTAQRSGILRPVCAALTALTLTPSSPAPAPAHVPAAAAATLSTPLSAPISAPVTPSSASTPTPTPAPAPAAPAPAPASPEPSPEHSSSPSSPASEQFFDDFDDVEEPLLIC